MPRANALSVRLGVEVQPVVVDGEGVSTGDERRPGARDATAEAKSSMR